MSEDWYYAVGQDRRGPVGEDEIRRLAADGEIAPQSWVWRAGMSDWKAADEALPAQLRPAHWPQTELPPQPPAATRAMPTSAHARSGQDGRGHPETFGDSVKAVFSRYATFTGRARRPEFWWFALFNLIVVSALSFIEGVAGSNSGTLAGIWNLAVFVPWLAVGARRLHDTGRTGWWLLIGLIPLVGLIVLIIFMAQKGEEGDNQYGPA